MRQHIKRQIRQGFTLIELSIVLLVISVLVGGSLSVGMTLLEANRIATSKEHIQAVVDALNDYAEENNHLPCPAVETLEPSDVDYGVGQGTEHRGGDGQPDEGNCTGSTEIDTTKRIFRGMVPIVELGLEGAKALDGWGNRLTYIVDEDLTFKGDTWTDNGSQKFGYANMGNPNLYDDQSLTAPVLIDDISTQGDIVIRNDQGVNGTDVSTLAAFVVISHGKNGFRAHTNDGIRLPASADANEEENADNDDTFIQKLPSSTFDDIVYYQNKWQIAAASSSQSNCPAGLSGCVLWLDATDIDGDGNTGNNPADGDPIGTWVDKSGTGNDVTSSGLARPSYIATDSDLNNQPVLGFDRSEGDYLERTSPSQLNLDPAEDTFTLAVVYARTSSQSSNVKVLELEGEDSDPNRPEITMQLLGGSDVARIITNNKNYGADHGATDLDVPNVWIAHFNEGSSSSEYSFNDSGPLAFGGGIVDRSDNTNSVLCIGTGSIDSLICDQTIHALDGRIAEVIIINRGLSSSERTALKSYLDCKWRGVNC